MNQILLYGNMIKKKKKTVFFRYQFILSIIFLYYFFLFYTNHIFLMKEEEKKSLKLLNIYNISRLYSSSDRNEDILNIQNINTSSPTIIIGIIEISKINIVYPILSKATDSLLKVSPCRFYGPLPNQSGNLCIAAHNYDDFRFFSKIDLLDVNDTIHIYDNTGNVLTYTIYRKYEASSDDLSCTKQTKNVKEITLVTCNNRNGNRIIIKAKYNS